MSETFSEEMTRRRIAAGLSRVRLAAAAGVHRGTIANIERGARPTTAEVVHRIRVALSRAEGHDSAPDSPWQQDWPQCNGRSLSCASIAAERDFLRAEVDRLRAELSKLPPQWEREAGGSDG